MSPAPHRWGVMTRPSGRSRSVPGPWTPRMGVAIIGRRHRGRRTARPSASRERPGPPGSRSPAGPLGRGPPYGARVAGGTVSPRCGIPRPEQVEQSGPPGVARPTPPQAGQRAHSSGDRASGRGDDRRGVDTGAGRRGPGTVAGGGRPVAGQEHLGDRAEQPPGRGIRPVERPGIPQRLEPGQERASLGQEVDVLRPSPFRLGDRDAGRGDATCRDGRPGDGVVTRRSTRIIRSSPPTATAAERSPTPARWPGRGRPRGDRDTGQRRPADSSILILLGLGGGRTEWPRRCVSERSPSASGPGRRPVEGPRARPGRSTAGRSPLARARRGPGPGQRS